MNSDLLFHFLLQNSLCGQNQVQCTAAGKVNYLWGTTSCLDCHSSLKLTGTHFTLQFWRHQLSFWVKAIGESGTGWDNFHWDWEARISDRTVSEFCLLVFFFGVVIYAGNLLSGLLFAVGDWIRTAWVEPFPLRLGCSHLWPLCEWMFPYVIFFGVVFLTQFTLVGFLPSFFL